MKKLLYRLGILLLVSSLCSCIEEHYMKFDTDFTGIYFTTDSTNYSFSVTPIEQREHLIKIPVQIMGTLDKADRDIKFEIIDQTSTAVDQVHYTLDKAVIPGDSTMGYIGIRVLRDSLKGNFVDGYESYKIHLRLLANEHFTPTLDSLSQVHLLKFDNAIEQPEWYYANNYDEKIWLKSVLGVWHPYKLIKMVEYFHALEEIEPLTYQKIAEEYGENLEHIPGGSTRKYATIFKRYIYKPMYDHFNDPNNRDMILSLYPDFPYDKEPPYLSDFPNPYPEK